MQRHDDSAVKIWWSDLKGQRQPRHPRYGACDCRISRATNTSAFAISRVRNHSHRTGGVLVSTLTGPSQQTAARYGVRALRYTVEADGKELDEILSLVAFGKVKPHVQKTYPLAEAAQALNSVERGDSGGKIVLTVE